MRVLIVDDSVVYRSQIKAALANQSGIEVVGAASNGKIALEMLDQKPVDVMTLDMEMPVMNGIETLKALRAKGSRVKVIVFSSSTRSGSEATLEALSNGAKDFIAKPDGSSAISEAAEDLIRKDLLPKIRQFASSIASDSQASRVMTPAAIVTPTPLTQSSIAAPSTYTRKELSTFMPSAVVIASSTGGPAAHDAIFKGLSGKLRCPIFIAQHMPPVFTTSFAKRIGSHTNLPSKEAKHGEVVANEIYVAPGDYHLSLGLVNGKLTTLLDQGPQRNSVRPAADFLFETAAQIFGPKTMGIVLTGMGEDGLAGCRAVKAANGGVMIQNQESCVVFGMPGAVHAAGAFDGQGDLSAIQALLARMAFE